MRVKVLSDEDKKKASEFLLNYKYAYVCVRCSRIYGSDQEEDSMTCPVCEGKVKLREEKIG